MEHGDNEPQDADTPGIVLIAIIVVALVFALAYVIVAAGVGG